MAARREDRIHELEREVQSLYEVNAKLVSQLEAQYKHMISVADTIQSVHIARIHNAMLEPTSDPAAAVHDFKADFVARSSSADMQLQALNSAAASQAALEQAVALRQLEDRARTWAKKFLHKVKAAASAAEARASGVDIVSTPPSSIPSVRMTRGEVRNTRDAHTPTEIPQFSNAHVSHVPSYGSDGSAAPRREVSQTEWRGQVTEEHIVIEDTYGHSGLSTPVTDDGARDKKKKKMFFNRLFTGRKT